MKGILGMMNFQQILHHSYFILSFGPNPLGQLATATLPRKGQCSGSPRMGRALENGGSGLASVSLRARGRKCATRVSAFTERRVLGVPGSVEASVRARVCIDRLGMAESANDGCRSSMNLSSSVVVCRRRICCFLLGFWSGFCCPLKISLMPGLESLTCSGRPMSPRKVDQIGPKM